MLSDKGFFIAVEGSDGSGKSTVTKMIAEMLTEAGMPVVTTYEVGGTPIGKELRKICFSKRDDEVVNPMARLLMVLASRIQHIDNVIVPALKQDKVVITDRYAASGYTYQAHVDGLKWEYEELMTSAKIELVPDLYIYLRTTPEVALARSSARVGLDNDVYKSDFEKACKIHEGYEKFFKELDVDGSESQVVVIDADQDAESIRVGLSYSFIAGPAFRAMYSKRTRTTSQILQALRPQP